MQSSSTILWTLSVFWDGYINLDWRTSPVTPPPPPPASLLSAYSSTTLESLKESRAERQARTNVSYFGLCAYGNPKAMIIYDTQMIDRDRGTKED